MVPLSALSHHERGMGAGLPLRPLTLAPLPTQPRISFVVTCYNYGRFLDECLESCLNQTLPVHEVVAVDDGSTDDTAERLALWQQRDHRIVVVKQANAGISAATQVGLTRCTGEVILLLDADDRCHPQRVAQVIEAMRTPLVAGLPGWIHHRLQKFSQVQADLGFTPTYLGDAPRGFFGDVVAMTAASSVSTPTSGLAFRRELLQRLLPLDIHRDTAQDIQFWHLLPLSAIGAWIEQPLSDYRVHSRSDSGGAGADQLTTPLKIKRQRIRCERCHAQITSWMHTHAPAALAGYPPLETSLEYLGLSFLDTWYGDGAYDRTRLQQVLNHPYFAAQHWQQRWFWQAARFLPLPCFRFFSQQVFGSGLFKRLIRRLLGRR